MPGKTVWRGSPAKEQHKCEPPIRDIPYGWPKESVGSIWQCICGQFWIVSNIKIPGVLQPKWIRISRRRVRKLTGGVAG